MLNPNKKYKPGQLVTINNHVYRITKSLINNDGDWICSHCDVTRCIERCTHMIGGCYFKLVKI